jgi:predicted Zn-dependent protease
MSIAGNFEKMLAAGQDSALLRYSLGTAYLKEGRVDAAVEQFAEALRQDAKYSAAWKVYGKALSEAGRLQEARDAYREGIVVAQEKGDLQAAKEMRVFLKRVEKSLG